MKYFIFNFELVTPKLENKNETFELVTRSLIYYFKKSS